MNRSPLVIGIGHPDRGDDAVGLRVADAITSRFGPSSVLASGGDPALLLDAWMDRELVVVVDAVIGTDDPPGTLIELDPVRDAIPVGMLGSSSHVLGLSEAIALGGLLDQMPERMVVLGVVGTRFEVGSDPGPEVREGIARAVARCAELLVEVGVAERPSPRDEEGGQVRCTSPE